MTARQEFERRDQILRAYIEGRDWDLDEEGKLRRHLVLQSHRLLPRWPLLVGIEWPAPDGSRGDLLFTDGQGSFAVVEIKSLGAQRGRTGRRGDVERQARKFAGACEELYPGEQVIPFVYTTDELDRDAAPRSPDKRWSDGAEGGA